MKIRLYPQPLIVLLFMLCLSACAAPTAQTVATQVSVAEPPATQAPPSPAPATQALPTLQTETQAPTTPSNAQVVLNMVERLNADDVDGSLAYFADEALSYFIGMPPTGIEVYRGAEALRPTWEYCVSDNFEWKVEITKVEGDLVYVKAKTWLDFTRGLGVAPNEFDEIYQVKDGKIMTYGSTMTSEALARFKPAFYEVLPPEPTALPSNDTPLSELTVTIADGTCTTNNPPALKAGEVTLRLDVEDQAKDLYALTLFNLDEGKDMLDLMVSTAETAPPDWADMLLLEELGPGESDNYTLTLEQGPVYLVCWSQLPALPIGNAGPIVLAP